MAEERLNEDEVLARLGISSDELEQMIEEGRLSAREVEGERTFAAEEIDALEGGADAPTLDLEGFDEGEDDELFSFTEELEGELSDEREEEEEAPLFAEEEIGTDIVDMEAPQAEGEEEGGEDLFEDEEVGTDILDMEAPEREGGEGEEELLVEFEDEGEKAEAEEDEEGEFVFEGEMDTEVVDVSSSGEAEEEILGDIIEDVGEAPEEPTQEATEEMEGEETVGMEEPTAEITELDEEEFSEEETAEITQLGPDFEEEEYEDILAEEEEFIEDESEEDYWDRGEGAVAPPAEEPVATWVVALLVIVFIIQVLGGLFVVENALNPDHSTGITDSLNFFKSE
jgi:hypothetical protein